MARPARDASRFQTDFLTNRGVGETFEAYSALVREDVGALTRYRYALLVILFAVNLCMSLALLFFAIHTQRPPSRAQWKTVSTTTSHLEDWMACRHVTDNERVDCAVINNDFCHAASKVTALLPFGSNLNADVGVAVLLSRTDFSRTRTRTWGPRTRTRTRT